MRRLILVEAGMATPVPLPDFEEADTVIALNPASLYALERARITAISADRYTDYSYLDALGEAAYMTIAGVAQKIDTAMAPMLPTPLTGEPVVSWLRLELKVLVDSLLAKEQILRALLKEYAPQEITLVSPDWPDDPLCGFLQYRALLEWLAPHEGYVLRRVKVRVPAVPRPTPKPLRQVVARYWRDFQFGRAVRGREIVLFADTDYCCGPLFMAHNNREDDIIAVCWPEVKAGNCMLTPATCAAAITAWREAALVLGVVVLEVLEPTLLALLRCEVPRLARARWLWLRLTRYSRLRAVVASHGLCVHAVNNALLDWAGQASCPFIVYQHGGLGCSHNPHLLLEVTATNTHLLTYGDGATRYAERNRRGKARIISVGNNRMTAA